MMITKWVGARVGIMGNPSDGFGGKTIACLIRNFGATVTVRENKTIEIVRHAQFDPLSFANITHLADIASQDGYYGGIRLLFAACKRFSDACREYGVVLPERNFILQYDTTVPRQVGLGGSSAIITATFRALMEFYGVTEDTLPQPILPSLILAVETEELGIAAGLQDRVVQVYGGLVDMDFDPNYVAAHGHGRYEHLDSELLPPMLLAWDRCWSDSGKIHSRVRHRFNEGDPEVHSAMQTWADYATQARQAMEHRDWASLAKLLDLNFDLRRRIYGEECIGERNLLMIDTLRSLGLPAKFAGSGGAVVGFSEDPERLAVARDALADEGFQSTTLTCADHDAHAIPMAIADTSKASPTIEVDREDYSRAA